LAHFDAFVLDYCFKDFNLITVTESWLNHNIDSSVIQIPNYQLLRNDRQNHRGGGIVAYIRNGLSYKIILSENYDFMQSLWVKIIINGEPHIFGIIYRPPHSNIQSFFSTLEETLIDLFSNFNFITCVGDFNIDVSKMYDSQACQLISLCDTFDLQQVITEPTRLTDSTSSIIDLIFTNYVSVLKTGIIGSTFSDHFGIFCEFGGVVSEILSQRVSYRSLKNINLNTFQADLEAIPFNLIYEFNSVDEKVMFLNNNLIELFDKNAPVKNIIVRKKKNSPWLTDNIKLLQKLRNKALKEFKKLKCQQNDTQQQQLRKTA